MLGVVALAHLAARELSASRVLALALLIVLLLDPWAVLAAGFWLSFGAVGLLFLIGGGRLGPAHWLIEWARAQWAVTLGMLPALLMLFQQFSLVSPLANALAIPLVSFVITPLAMLGSLPLLDPVLVVAHIFTTALMMAVDGWRHCRWRSGSGRHRRRGPCSWLWPAASGCCCRAGFPSRWLGLLALPAAAERRGAAAARGYGAGHRA
jgi:competence protein ComEC